MGKTFYKPEGMSDAEWMCMLMCGSVEKDDKKPSSRGRVEDEEDNDDDEDGDLNE